MILTTRNPIYSAIALATTCACAFAGSPATTWTICTDELELIESKIERITQSEIILVDEFGLRESLSTADLFFAFPRSPMMQRLLDEPILESQTTHFITLIDGQVVRAIILPDSDPEYVNCTVLAGDQSRGEAFIPLERIQSISQDRRLVSMTTNDDTITTNSGDVLTGFIESIGETTVIDSGTGLVRLQLAQIDSIALANIKEPVVGMYVTTTDGSRIMSSVFDIDFRHTLSMGINSQSIGLEMDAPATWLFDPDAASAIHIVHGSQRIESLAAIEPEIIEPTGNRSWTPTPTVIPSTTDPVFSAIDLRAPVRVVYRIPSNTSRFACTLNAPINTWTDCVAKIFSISGSGKPTLLFSSPINAEFPSHDLDLKIRPGVQQLEFLIEPGKHGPIQDRVLIEKPRLLIES